MAMNYVPGNSVEFETLTTEPSYGDLKEFDRNPYIDDQGKERAVPEHWRTLGVFRRDLRFGNIKHRHDDVEWLEDRAGLSVAMINFRGATFDDLAPLALAPVAATIELSQSREGFFRKNSRTFHNTSENYDETSAGGLSKLFGGGKKKQGGY